MEANFKQDHITDKAERYKTFLRQFAPLIEGETHEISVLANTCAALKEAFGFFWVGFYLAENDELAKEAWRAIASRKDGACAEPPGNGCRHWLCPTWNISPDTLPAVPFHALR